MCKHPVARLPPGGDLQLLDRLCWDDSNHAQLDLLGLDECRMHEPETSVGRCYGCFRPTATCFCDSIPRIENQTEVLILQHRRERFHPFNTARIVQKSLRNSLLLSDYAVNLARQLRLSPRAGLLYPGPQARPISDLPPEERPEQLVVLDGTWHHAKTLIRDIPALRTLPRYGLSRKAPSRYRIRREPSAALLSTVEAAVAALRFLEPQTEGFDQLLAAFDVMVEEQLAHPGSANGQRFRERHARTFRNIPVALLGDLKNIVVAYGEAAAGEPGHKGAAGPPISWLAQRLGTGEVFSCLLTPRRPLDGIFLGHLALTRADFDAAIPLDKARRRWAKFHRPTDVVTVYYPGTARLFAHLAGAGHSCLVLKAVDIESNSGLPNLESRWQSPDISVEIAQNYGRAGKRLAGTIAVVRHLNSLGLNATIRGKPGIV